MLYSKKHKEVSGSLYVGILILAALIIDIFLLVGCCLLVSGPVGLMVLIAFVLRVVLQQIISAISYSIAVHFASKLDEFFGSVGGRFRGLKFLLVYLFGPVSTSISICAYVFFSILFLSFHQKLSHGYYCLLKFSGLLPDKMLFLLGPNFLCCYWWFLLRGYIFSGLKRGIRHVDCVCFFWFNSFLDLVFGCDMAGTKLKIGNCGLLVDAWKYGCYSNNLWNYDLKDFGHNLLNAYIYGYQIYVSNFIF